MTPAKNKTVVDTANTAAKTADKAIKSNPKVPRRKSSASSRKEPETLDCAAIADAGLEGKAAKGRKTKKNVAADEIVEAGKIGKSAHLTPNAQKILDAITANKVVELVFKDTDANAARNFEPRSLSYDSLEQAWHVWGWDRRYNADRHHRLDALAEINLVEGVGRAAQGPFSDDTPPNHIGGWLGGEPIAVKVLLSKQSAYYVRNAPAPFPAFTVTDAEDGRVQISFTATDFRAIAKWCMQFGDGIQILEPGRLSDRLKQVGYAWGAKPHAAPATQQLNQTLPSSPNDTVNVRPELEPATEQPAKNIQQTTQYQKHEDTAIKGKPASQRVEIRVERL